MEAVSSVDLKTLERILQERLQSCLGQSEPLRIQCAIKEDVLMVLGQHSAQIVPDPQQTLKVLEQEIRELEPRLQQETDQLIQLYLRVVGQAQPYIFHRFEIALPAPDVAEAQLESLAQSTFDALADEEDDRDVNRGLTTTNQDVAITRASDDELDLTLSDDDGLDLTLSDLDDDGLDLTLSEPEMSDVPFAYRAPQSRRSLPVLFAAGGLLISLGALLVYGLTRPCVVGGCQPIETAQALDRATNDLLQRSRLEKDLRVVRSNLATALQKLETIPGWSNRKSEAQMLAQTYRTQIATLDQILLAYQQANAAAQKSLNPPHPVKHWQDIQQLWRTAIAQLEQVSPGDRLYSLARQKMKEYQGNLATISQRIQLEQRAQVELNRTKSTAKVAETLEGIAQNLESWQQAQSTWQVAVSMAQKIPKGTTAHQEVQSLLTDYQAKLITARNRATREQLAAKTHNQAVKLAKDARNFEQQEQWSLAVTRWREAVKQAKQVPADTVYAEPADALAQEYTDALSQAETQLGAAAKLQQAKADLSRTCAGAVRICDFNITATLIRVQLTSGYMQTLLRAAAASRNGGDVNAQIRVNEHLQSLQTALETISQNSGIPIEIYNANSSLMGRFTP